jgi:hypothetical protein
LPPRPRARACLSSTRDWLADCHEGAECAWNAVWILEAFIADFSTEPLRAAAMM